MDDKIKAGRRMINKTRKKGMVLICSLVLVLLCYFIPNHAAVADVTSCQNLPVKICGTTPTYFSTLQAAYNVASDGDVIQSLAVTFTENLTLNRNISITIDGGYECGYAAYSGKSALKGMITDSVGKLAIGNFNIVSSSPDGAYAITSSAGPGGAISPAGTTSVVEGGSQTYMITPDAGYAISQVLVDAVSVGTPTTYQLTNVTAAHTITASFIANTYTITATAGANGTISPSGTVSAISGATATFIMTPNTGYHISNVLVDGVSKGAITSHAFTNVVANHTISASFEADGDTTPPTGSIVINNGAAFTNTTIVTLTLSATDSGSAVSHMQFSNDGSTWSTPELYTTSKSWTLSTGDGTKTVYAKFKDNAGNWSNAIPSNTIILDTTPPAVSITSPADGFTNNKTPLLSYAVSDGAVVVKVDGIIVPKISGNNLDSLSDGAHTVRVVSTDAANNLGFAELSFTLDTLPPLVAGEMPEISTISAGNDHSLAIATDGSLWAWGANWSGNLGDGTVQPRNSPKKVGADITWSAISAGYDANLALKSDGTLWAWGANWYGQLGDGTTDDKLAPVQIGLDTNWKSISMKGYHGLALKQDGTLWSWGVNWDGEVGDGTTEDRHFPIQIGTDTNWTAVSAGFWHSFALKSDGTLWAWGANWYGQLGDGTTDDKHAPVQIGIDADWIVADEGDSGSFALKSSGNLWAWGSNRGGWYGVLGDGTFTDHHAPVQIGIDNNWASIAASGEGKYVLALKTDGTLWAWGSNWDGQLLNGTYYDQYVPIQIDTDNTWSAISAGLYHSIALKPDGTLWTWGYNDQGLLGDGTYQDIYTPHRIDYISVTSNVILINSGADTTNSVSVTLNLNASDMTSGIAMMRLSNDGLAWSAPEPYAMTKDWTLTAGDGKKTVYVMFQDGAGNWSSVFSASIILDTRPPTVAVTSPASGLTYNATPLLSYTVSKGTVIVTVDGATVNKGSGDQLGPLIDGQHVVRVTATDEFGIAAFTEVTFTVDIAPPLAGTMPKFIEIAAGWDHSLAIVTDGSLWAWGANWAGQLGDGMTTVFSSTPEKIGMDSTWSSVSASDYCSLALKPDGTLWAWGLNWYGNLGIGTHNEQYTPAQIGTDNNWKSIATSLYHSAALKQDGTLWAWGANGSGELGDGTIVERLSPVLVAGNVISVAVGAFHTVAVKSDGTLWTWGANEWGQLGNGTMLENHAPVQIGIDNDWISAAAGYYSSYALKSNGTLWAWGGNWGGELGDGTGDGTSDHNKYAPVQVGTESTWSSIFANGQGFHVLALRSDGSLWAWGFNGCGQLGDGTIVDKNVPIPIAAGTLWSSAAASFCHSIALKSDGTMWSWGDNEDGQLGDGTTQDRTTPHYIFDRDVIVINNGDGYTAGTTATLTLNAWDTTSGVAYMQFSADEITWSTPEHYAATKNWTLSEGDGLKTVYVKFQDGAGHWSAAYSASIVMDTTPPVISITWPIYGTYTNVDLLYLYYDASDALSLPAVSVIVDGVPVPNFNNHDSLGFLFNGEHTIRVEATDAVGHVSFAEVNITVATSLPTVSITSPSSGATNNRTPMLTYTVSDGAVVVKMDGAVINKLSGSVLDTLAAGSHTVRVEATNASGTGFAEVTFTVDTVAPVVTITSPAAGSRTRAPTLSYTVSDGSVIVMVDNVVYSGALSALPNGSHTVKVIATDAAGNIGSAQVSFIVDTTPPTVFIVSPVEGLVQQASVPLIYGASDGTVTVTFDGAPSSIPSGGTLNNLANGSHTLVVSSTDIAGNTGSASVTFMVDTFAGNDDTNIYCMGTGTVLVGPSTFTNGISVPSSNNTVLIASPTDGSTITGTKIIIKGAMDTTVPVNSVMVVVTSPSGTAGYPAQVNGKYFAAKVPLAADTTTISAIATDQTGTKHQASVNVTVTTQSDNVDLSAAPSTGILTLKQNGQTTLDVGLMSSATTTHPVVSYAWDFNGSGANQLTCYSHSNVTASYQQTGLYLTTVTVTDTAGNHYKDTVIVNVVDATDLHNRIMPTWNGMKTALLDGNIEGALGYFADPSKARYNQLFAAVSSANITTIFATITEMRLKTTYGPVAEYWVLRQESQGTFAYPVTFIQDENGNWKIMGF